MIGIIRDSRIGRRHLVSSVKYRLLDIGCSKLVIYYIILIDGFCTHLGTALTKKKNTNIEERERFSMQSLLAYGYSKRAKKYSA